MVFKNFYGSLNVEFKNLQELKSEYGYNEKWKENGLIEVTMEMLKQ